MPIIQHGIQEALRQAGIVKDSSDAPTTVNELLDDQDLSLRQTIQHLADIASGADTSAVKLRAIETALKLRGVLKEQAAPPPTFNIIINDKSGNPSVNGLNPILIPRPRPVEEVVM